MSHHAKSFLLHLCHLSSIIPICPISVGHLCASSAVCVLVCSPVYHSRLHVFALVMKLRNRNQIQRPARYQQVVALSRLIVTQVFNYQPSESSRRCSFPLVLRHLLFVLPRVYPKISVTAFFSEAESDDYQITITALYSDDGSEELSRSGLCKL